MNGDPLCFSTYRIKFLSFVEVHNIYNCIFFVFLKRTQY